MKKFLALMMSMMMVLSFAACGGDDTTDANDGANTPDTTVVDNNVPDTTVADTTVTSALLNWTLLAIDETGLAGTGWEFAGGCFDGVEMTQDEANAALQQYGGKLQFIFGADGAVSMVQGGGALNGTYEVMEDNGTTFVKVVLDNQGTDLKYVCVFSTLSNGDIFMIALSDNTMMNGIYFTQITEG